MGYDCIKHFLVGHNLIVRLFDCLAGAGHLNDLISRDETLCIGFFIHLNPWVIDADQLGFYWQSVQEPDACKDMLALVVGFDDGVHVSLQVKLLKFCDYSLDDHFCGVSG